MNKKTLENLKQKLEEEKKLLEKVLKSFAKKDKNLPEDWDTLFPFWNGEAGGAALEKAADEVEEYGTRLPIEYKLETKLKNINLALEKMKKGKYGICEKCKKLISIGRLKILPEARFCKKCFKK